MARERRAPICLFLLKVSVYINRQLTRAQLRRKIAGDDTIREVLMPSRSILAASLALAVASGSAAAQSLRFSFQSDAGTLDPYGLNETFTLGFLGNVYEGLITRGPDLAIQPGLAERWEILEPTRWRFYLRRSVTFHDGSPSPPKTWSSLPNGCASRAPISRTGWRPSKR